MQGPGHLWRKRCKRSSEVPRRPRPVRPGREERIHRVPGRGLQAAGRQAPGVHLGTTRAGAGVPGGARQRLRVSLRISWIRPVQKKAATSRGERLAALLRELRLANHVVDKCWTASCMHFGRVQYRTAMRSSLSWLGKRCVLQIHCRACGRGRQRDERCVLEVCLNGKLHLALSFRMWTVHWLESCISWIGEMAVESNPQVVCWRLKQYSVHVSSTSRPESGAWR